MPTYDFRCHACAARREVRAPYEVASGLELVCTACGGTMVKAFTAAVALLTSAEAGPSSFSPGPRVQRPRGGDSCDAAIRLTRPNPFASELGRDASGPEHGQL